MSLSYVALSADLVVSLCHWSVGMFQALIYFEVSDSNVDFSSRRKKKRQRESERARERGKEREKEKERKRVQAFIPQRRAQAETPLWTRPYHGFPSVGPLSLSPCGTPLLFFPPSILPFPMMLSSAAYALIPQLLGSNNNN